MNLDDEINYFVEQTEVVNYNDDNVIIRNIKSFLLLSAEKNKNLCFTTYGNNEIILERSDCIGDDSLDITKNDLIVKFIKRYKVPNLDKDDRIFIKGSYVVFRTIDNVKIYDFLSDKFLENENVEFLYKDNDLYLIIHIRDEKKLFDLDIVGAKTSFDRLEINEIYSVRQDRWIPIYNSENISFEEKVAKTLSSEVFEYIIENGPIDLGMEQIMERLSFKK